MRAVRRTWRWLRALRPPLRLREYEAPPTPPPAPRGYLEYVEDRGEIFYRDSGPESAHRGTVLLLHGWLVEADVNWAVVYAPLIAEGYRVIAPDHRGHGRGIRSTFKFTLADVAEDAAALLRHLETGPVIAVGYSMGGAVAQLLARDHPEQLSGVVLAATALQWQNPGWVRASWKLMSVLQVLLRLFPRRVYEWTMREVTIGEPGLAHWLIAELQRGDARDIAEAGRQLSEFDSRRWIKDINVPVAVICTAHDHLVPPSSQREIAQSARDAVLVEIPADHLSALSLPGVFSGGLVRALQSIEERASPVAAAVGGVIGRPADPSLPVESRA